MKLLIIHLSDMHFTETENYNTSKVTAIVSALNNYAQGLAHALVIVSGDLSFSGKQNECKK